MLNLDAPRLTQLLLLLVPILLVQLGLMIFALVDLVRRQRVHGPKWVWAIIIIVGELIGCVVYLVFAREE